MTGSRWSYVLGVLAVLLALVTSPLFLESGRPPERYYFGTLQTDPSRARLERETGIEVVHMPIFWDRFEPVDGEYDSQYLAELKERLRTFKEAGVRIEAGLGVNHPPRWLMDRHPQDTYVDQSGERDVDNANVVFSQDVRAEVEQYVQRLAEDIGLDNFWAIRIGVNEAGELTYPPPSSAADGARASYWAFDRNAQASGADHDRPATIPPNPFPGWRPGERTYREASFAQRQVAQWYDWYLVALGDAVNWQIEHYGSLGYRGLLKVLIPGAGLYPRDRTAAIRGYLDEPVSTNLTGRGAAFFTTIGHVQPRRNVQIVSTALVDGSGIPANNACRREDAGIRIDSDGDDAEVRTWSSVRWVSRIAAHHGFPIGGESAGPQVAAYYPGVMDDAERQMKTCGLRGLMWAFDRNLYDGTPGSSLQEYAAVIDRSRREES
ncbi:beta-galactosidase [Streptomyces xiangluensis]|uniref:Beta-galactosidase n=1 Tax=Streptomyces xiangluensis TaxID=2665720 RepID=A0ABV8Z5D7_9ACTN